MCHKRVSIKKKPKTHPSSFVPLTSHMQIAKLWNIATTEDHLVLPSHFVFGTVLFWEPLSSLSGCREEASSHHKTYAAWFHFRTVPPLRSTSACFRPHKSWHFIVSHRRERGKHVSEHVRGPSLRQLSDVTNTTSALPHVRPRYHLPPDGGQRWRVTPSNNSNMCTWLGKCSFPCGGKAGSLLCVSVM